MRESALRGRARVHAHPASAYATRGEISYDTTTRSAIRDEHAEREIATAAHAIACAQAREIAASQHRRIGPSMTQELSGRVAIVTGGASGLGRATVELFVEEGARVVIADVDEQAGKELAGRLGGSAVFQKTDVSQPDQVQALVDLAVSRFGALHVMFNNAGISGARGGGFLEADLEDFERVMAVNLFGVMVGAQRAARQMVAQGGGGSIINTSSIGALLPGGGVMPYRTSKAAVVLFSKALAVELGEHGIRVNCLAPGLIETPMTKYDMAAVRSRMQPLNRKGTPADVANAALYLASDRSAQVTGLVLTVDGGTSVGPPSRPIREAAFGRGGGGGGGGDTR